jgi:hypothetical protein
MIYFKLKSWQTFTLLMFPIILEGLLPIYKFEWVHTLLIILFCVIYVHWLYSLGNEMHKILPNFANLSLKRFHFLNGYLAFLFALSAVGRFGLLENFEENIFFRILFGYLFSAWILCYDVHFILYIQICLFT